MRPRLILPFAASLAAFGLGLAFIFATENADEVKAQIVAEFKADPSGFRFDAASQRLANSRIDGEFAVCTPMAEATADQYVEVSSDVDSYGSQVPGLKLAVNMALRGDGVSDCDYRVLMLLINDHKHELMAGLKKSPAETIVTEPRT
jgi:hypothetical protein